MQSSELITQNSELRTQNSELRTQNSELRTQNSELRTQNSELRNALSSTGSRLRRDVGHGWSGRFGHRRRFRAARCVRAKVNSRDRPRARRTTGYFPPALIV